MSNEMQHKAVYLLFCKFTLHVSGVVTVLCTPDEGFGWCQKHVEWTCRIINRLLCVASRWTIVTINDTVFLWRRQVRYAPWIFQTLKVMFHCILYEIYKCGNSASWIQPNPIKKYYLF